MPVGIIVAVPVGTKVSVLVGVTVAVPVGNAVAVLVSVAVAVLLGITVAVRVEVAVSVAVAGGGELSLPPQPAATSPSVSASPNTRLSGK